MERPNITLYDNNTRPLMDYADHLEAENKRLRELYENVTGNRERFGWTINHLLECEETLHTTEAEVIDNHAELVRLRRIVEGVQSKTALDIVVEKMKAEDEVRRLLRVMAAALERTQVDDSGEATMILEAEVNLDGTKVEK